MDDKPDELVSVIQVGRALCFIGDPVVEVLIGSKIVSIKGDKIEASDIMDAASFEPRFNPAAPHSTPERQKV